MGSRARVSWVAVPVACAFLAACGASAAGADDGGTRADVADGADSVDAADGAVDPGGDLPATPDVAKDADAACVPECDAKYGFACVDGVCRCLAQDEYGCMFDRERWRFPACGVGEAEKVDVCPFGCLDGACRTCTPDCAGRACNHDGCGGSCGQCDAGFACQDDGRCLESCGARDCGGDGAGHLCGQCADAVACIAGHCGQACAAPPVPAGPPGRLVRFWVPATAEETAALCPDLTADGTGDNGIRGLAGQLNGLLQDLADTGSLALVLEPPVVAGPDGRLVLLRTTPAGGDPAGPLSIDPDTWDPVTCEPQAFLDVVEDGAALREAVPGTLPVPWYALMDEWFEVRLAAVRLKAPRAVVPSGLALGPGAVAGVFTRQEAERWATYRQEFCATLPYEEYRDRGCGISTIVGAWYWFDLSRNPDGTWRKRGKEDPQDGGSICLAFETVPAVLASP